jgi:hypothetical protein
VGVWNADDGNDNCVCCRILDDNHVSNRLYCISPSSVISSHASKLNVMLDLTCKVLDY